MIGHHVQVAIHDIAIPHRRGDIRKNAGIVKGIVRIQKSDGVALKQAKALVHGIVDALVLLRENTDRVRAERLDDLDGRIARCPVNHQHFLFRMRLLQKRFDGEADRCLGIVAGCYDADLHWYLRRHSRYRGEASLSKNRLCRTHYMAALQFRQVTGTQSTAPGRACYSGTSIGAAPCARFSALKIHTRPPNAPMINDTQPNKSDTFTPSAVASPA